MTPEDRLLSHKPGDPVTEQDLIDALTIARKLGEDLIEARAEVERLREALTEIASYAPCPCSEVAAAALAPEKEQADG